MQTVKLLSKKQRKRYEKLVEKKKKNEEVYILLIILFFNLLSPSSWFERILSYIFPPQRAALLEALSKVQATPELLAQLTSITEVQTKGRKRMYDNVVDTPNETTISHTKRLKLKAIKGNQNAKIAPLPKTTDPNVVGFDVSSHFRSPLRI